jgi:hypothetical protein
MGIMMLEHGMVMICGKNNKTFRLYCKTDYKK